VSDLHATACFEATVTTVARLGPVALTCSDTRVELHPSAHAIMKRSLPDEGGLLPFFGTKLFMLAQASISVSTEVFAGEQAADLRQVQNARKELGRDITVEQSISVLAEHRGIPHRFVRREPNEPAKQQIVVELFHQLPFRSHRVERLRQQRSQQSRRPPLARIEPVERRRVNQFADRPQG
jgi:hypothetical protein